MVTLFYGARKYHEELWLEELRADNEEQLLDTHRNQERERKKREALEEQRQEEAKRKLQQQITTRIAQSTVCSEMISESSGTQPFKEHTDIETSVHLESKS